MGRWQPGARGRLAAAAFELFREHGYEQTTAADIAHRADLSERTFFRHYADKREVLFGGAQALQELIVARVAQAPPELAPMAAAAAGLEAIDELIDNRDYSIARQAVIDANPELQERELIKLAALAAAIAQTLRDRGVPEPSAGLTAQAAVGVFKVAFERWVAPGDPPSLGELIADSLRELGAVTAAIAP